MYKRPWNTTANPNWALAERPVDLIPLTEDWMGEGDRMSSLCGNFILTQGKQAGMRLDENMADWQDASIRYIFGKRDGDGNREVRKVFWKLGKGSGKTVLVSAIGLGFLMDCVLRNKHHRSLVVIVAASVNSANIAFEHILEAIVADPELKDHFRVQTQYRQVRHVGTGIVIRVLAPNMKSAVGLRPILIIVDELHAAAVEIKDFSKVMDQLRRGSANYGTEALELIISTSPPHKAVGAYRDILAYARQVRDGHIFDPHFLPILFEFPVRQRPDLDIASPGEWWRGVPSLGYTMDASEMVRELKEIQQNDSKESLSLLLSQRLGVEPDDRGEAIGEFILQKQWKDIPNRPRTVPTGLADLAIAVDPGGAEDPMAIAYLWQDTTTYRYQIVVDQYIVESALERADAVLADVFKQAIACGELSVYPTFALMDAAIGRKLTEILDTAEVFPALGGDVHGRTGVTQALTELTGLPFRMIPQGWKLAAPQAAMESWMLDGIVDITHGPLLDANVENLRVTENDAGVKRYAKADTVESDSLHPEDLHGQCKIDGIITVLSVVALRAIAGEKTPQVAVEGLIG
jgi:phage terminase large subunit-like protein